jgi:hypothetical protein
MAKITAIMMISVPIPIPKMRVELVVCALPDCASIVTIVMISFPIMYWVNIQIIFKIKNSSSI